MNFMRKSIMIKKRAVLTVICLVLLAGVVSAVAAGGSASDPLISLSYLNGLFTSKLDGLVDTRLDASDQTLLDSAAGKLQGGVSSCASAWTETRLKESDLLTGTTGTNVMLLAGAMKITFSSGAVIDATEGSAVTSGSAMAIRHRYIVAEDTSAAFTVTSKTAVADYQGYYAFTYSDAVDYNAIAAALKQLSLFKGSYTGYGQGYDLEVAPTRIQALIMFIRVLGEEDAALSSTGTTPFTDVATGSNTEKYVAYAYGEGYTNGYSKTLFKPDQTITVNQYMEFMLRALGYSSTATSNLSDTLTRALNHSVINVREQAMLQSDPFLRAELVYISYYALDANVAGTGLTLRQTLLSQGVFTSADITAAGALAPSGRLS